MTQEAYEESWRGGAGKSKQEDAELSVGARPQQTGGREEGLGRVVPEHRMGGGNWRNGGAVQGRRATPSPGLLRTLGVSLEPWMRLNSLPAGALFVRLELHHDTSFKS